MLTEVDERKGLVKTEWMHVRDRVAKVAPVFANLVDALSPDSSYPIFLAYYPFGTFIGDTESPLFPARSGESYRITDPCAPSALKTHLGYGNTSAPFGLILEKNFETFIDRKDDGITIPWEILSPGMFFPVNKILNNPKQARNYPSNKVLSAAAGARSTFMLPSIGCVTKHNGLKRDFHVQSSAPKQPYDHWGLFKEITQSPIINSDWRACLIYLSEKWMQHLHNDPAWLPLKAHLHQQAWLRSEYMRSRMYYEVGFSVIQKKRNLKPNPYLADTARHLIAIALGDAPGYVPACDDSYLPLGTLQKVFYESYGLRKYVPTIMQPDKFIFEHSAQPTYYSIQIPSTYVFSPKARKVSSTLSELRELVHIMKCFIEELGTKEAICADTVLYQIAHQVDFQYFHNEADKHGVISMSDAVVKSDSRFLFLDSGLRKNMECQFASDARFLRGCIRIAKR